MIFFLYEMNSYTALHAWKSADHSVYLFYWVNVLAVGFQQSNLYKYISLSVLCWDELSNVSKKRLQLQEIFGVTINNLFIVYSVQ